MNFLRFNQKLYKFLRGSKYFVTPAASALVVLSVPSSTVKAQPFASIIVSGTLDLNFGTFAAGAGGGTVSMSTAGVRTSTGTVVLTAGAGLESPASLSISASTGGRT